MAVPRMDILSENVGRYKRLNGIVSSDGEYQAILRKSDIYSGELDRMDLSKEIRLLIDRYVSEQNALGSRFGMLAYLLGFSDCKAMFFQKNHKMSCRNF